MNKAKLILTAVLNAALGIPCAGQALPMFTVSQFQSPNGQPFYINWMSDDGNTLVGSVWDPTIKDPLFQQPIGQCFVTQNGSTTFFPTPGFSCGVGLGRSANSKGQFAGVLTPVGTFAETAFANLDGTFDMVGARLPGVAHDQIPECAPNCAVAQ